MHNDRSKKLTIVLIAAAVLLCLYGAATGEMVIVFTKAATICMECIGLD